MAKRQRPGVGPADFPCEYTHGYVPEEIEQTGPTGVAVGELEPANNTRPALRVVDRGPNLHPRHHVQMEMAFGDPRTLFNQQRDNYVRVIDARGRTAWRLPEDLQPGDREIDP